MGWASTQGVGLPHPPAGAVSEHGLLMAGSFLGMLISIKLLATRPQRWPYVFPFLMALALPAALFQYQAAAYGLLAAGRVVKYLANVLTIALNLVRKKDN